MKNHLYELPSLVISNLKIMIIIMCLSLSACSPSETIFSNTTSSNQLNVSDETLNRHLTEQSHSAAHWLTQDTLVIPKNSLFKKNIKALQLISVNIIHPKIGNDFTIFDFSNFISLTATALSPELMKKFPHMADYQAFSVNLPQDIAKLWLKQELVVAALFDDNDTQITRVQFSNVMDDLYTKGKNDADEVMDLGATVSKNTENNSQVTFKLWAPTASKVNVILYDADTQQAIKLIEMLEDTATGVWSTSLKGNYHLSYYQYEITMYHDEYQANIPGRSPLVTIRTTDPYSLSLSTNSVFSQIIDLSDPATMPKGWDTQQNIELIAPEDAIIYETHIRDFSSTEQHLSDEQFRGKYKAFSEKESDGIKHIKALKEAGLNHIHLLPTFDLGTINENATYQISLADNLGKICDVAPETTLCQTEFDKDLTLKQLLASFDPVSSEAQAVVSELRIFDDYNWGYDPYHYTVPEGSYAVNPEGHSRIIEFREMVQSLHEMGFRVIMDVVYNHTHQAGLARTSVLDKIVPNYYQRLHPITGQIEQSTCCDNTATEHVMMKKLMIDSLVTWAKEYKIDGFRFDLMGHQPKLAMIEAREAVRKVDPDTYFYGEGWNFGEVANNQQFIQASQLELAGTEIGTFTDRLRDAVRGSSFNVSGFDHRKNQGIGNGLGTFNNEMQNTNFQGDYLLKMDQLRIGLAGNLADFPLENNEGLFVLGKEITYGDQAAGYALDPADTINYVSKHDNQTLWDNSQYRLPFEATTEQRVRLHNQSLSYAILAQGIPFLHMGSELLRSKSFLRDSYDYGDWFNAVDYSMQSNNYHVGLPPEEKDAANWPLITQLLNKNEGRDKVTKTDIEFSSAVFKSFLKIRSNSRLFRLTSAQEIIDKITFLNTGKTQVQGLIVMLIDNDKGSPITTKFQKIIVVFNNNPAPKTFSDNNFEGLVLHPVLKNGIDTTTASSQISSKNGQWQATVPGFTTAVFVTADH